MTTYSNPVLQDWLDSTDDAIEALFTWKAYLQAWRNHPNVTDAAFMAAVQNMSQAGLWEWLDSNQADIDALREVVTNGS